MKTDLAGWWVAISLVLLGLLTLPWGLILLAALWWVWRRS